MKFKYVKTLVRSDVELPENFSPKWHLTKSRLEAQDIVGFETDLLQKAA